MPFRPSETLQGHRSIRLEGIKLRPHRNLCSPNLSLDETGQDSRRDCQKMKLIFLSSLQTTTMTPTGRHLVTRLCACCPTVSARRTALASRTTCQPRRCRRWLRSRSTTLSTTITSSYTRRYSTASAGTRTGATSKPRSSSRTSTPTTQPCRRLTGRDTRSPCTRSRKYDTKADYDEAKS